MDRTIPAQELYLHPLSALKRVALAPAKVYLIGLVAGGAVLRFWDIAKSSIWHDEGYTMMLAQMPSGEIVMRTARDVHPPLYYLILHYWLGVFGTSETAARSLSAVCLLILIPVAYALVRRVWNEKAALVAALFVTTGPFLVRYSQEARMYGMVAFLLTLATYLLVRAFENNRWSWWSAYSITVAAALYTHYYSAFVILAHILYAAICSNKRTGSGFWNYRWWVSNVAALVLFLPWVPIAIGQFQRIQNAFWIFPATSTTLPETLLQFLYYKHGDAFSEHAKIGFGLILLGVIGLLYWRKRKYRPGLFLISALSLVGPVLVWLVSYIGTRPIYIDRYFVFAAVGFYCLLGIAVSTLRTWLLVPTLLVILLVFHRGIDNIHAISDHKMRDIGAYVNSNYAPGDEILSGEIYTFFDFSYYNHTGSTVRLWSTEGVSGYGESSLIYDRSNQIVVRNLADIHPASGVLWVVGKPGVEDYYTKIPANWQAIGPHIISGTCAVQEYRVLSVRGGGRVAVQ